MSTINLSDLENSEIKYNISQFPDGQQDIVIQPKSYIGNKAMIKSRFNSFRDLELIIATNKALRRKGVDEVHLYIPYLLGARSDRLFQEGGNSYLVDVVAPIINAQGFKSVTVYDVHSDVAAACINNLNVTTNQSLVSWAISHIHNPTTYDFKKSMENIVIISPDAGAQKKIYTVAEKIGYTGEIITASKHRDLKSGKILETKVDTSLIKNRDCVIIDDICDGGRTFIEIAKVITDNPHYTGNMYLIVSHGIFSNGLKELQKYFNGIYCTNSVSNIGKTMFDGWNEKKTSVMQSKII